VLAVFDPLAHDEPYDAYRVLRDEFPVYRNDARGFWALSRFDDVQRAAREWRAFSSAAGVNLDDTVSLTGPGNLIVADPPDHERLRNVVRGRFTRATIAAMEPAIRHDVATTLTAAARDGGFDAAAELAWALPVRTISRLLGLPVRDEPALGGWLREVIRREPGADRLPPAARDAGERLRGYFRAQVAARGAGSHDDLLADIVAAERGGELDPDELPGLCILLYVAGTETVADFVGNALAVLAEHPEQRALLAAEPERIAAAVEELLRFESPVQYQARTATADLELHGATIPAGSPVVLLWGAANRDERRWERAGELDITRAAKRNLAFGEGIHHCLGAPLARLQGRIVLEEMLRLAPAYRLAGALERVATHNTRGVARLPLALA
jgi:cytochrome P450